MKFNINNLINISSQSSKIVDFQDLDHIDGVSISAVSAGLYKVKRDEIVLFYFRDGANYASLYTQSKLIEVQSPLGLDLLSPGGTFKELSSSYTYSTIPLFTWYADYCPNCEYAIRVCEFDQNKHESLQDALTLSLIHI